MRSLSVSTKFDTNKNHVSVNPVNNINVNVGERSLSSDRLDRTRSLDPSSLDGVTVVNERSSLSSYGANPSTGDVNVKYPDDVSPYSEIEIKELQQTVEALKIIISMMKDNPIIVNKLILVDDAKLAQLVKLLTDADEVTIDAEDLGSGCCTPHTYRKVHAIYVIKDGNTKNLKYDFPSITKELKDLGINTKIVW